MRALPRVFSAALAVLLGAGCALTSKSDSVNFRYFTPEGAPARNAATPGKQGTSTNLELRLGRVNAASYIKDRIAYRASEYEVGFYEELRWTEKPEAYVRRALVRSLFEENGVKEVISGPGLILEVDLDAFEELRTPRHAAYVRLTWMLHGAQAVLVQKTFTVERPLTSSGAEAVAGALADALQEAIHAMVTEVLGEVARSAAESATKEGDNAP